MGNCSRLFSFGMKTVNNLHTPRPMVCAMLKEGMSSPDINGDVFTRQRLRSNAANFKKDSRIRAKEFTFNHHRVVDLHGARHMVCVTDPETASVLLYESGPLHEDAFAISDCHPLKFTAMRTEAERQLSFHIADRAEKVSRRKKTVAK